MAKNKCYIDRNHPENGVYMSWADCEREKAKGGTNFYGYPSVAEAEAEIAKLSSGGASTSTKAPQIQVLGQMSLFDNQPDFVPGTYMGSDEVGKIEPLKQAVVVAVYVTADKFAAMRELGVDDSKKIASKINNIGKDLTGFEKYEDIKSGLVYENPEFGLTFCPIILSNREYNIRKETKNANVILTELHNEANCKLYEHLKSKGIKVEKAIIDDYMDGRDLFGKYSKESGGVSINQFIPVSFEVKADGTYKEIVGTASDICAYIDYLWQDYLNLIYGMELDYGNNIKLASLQNSFNRIKEINPEGLEDIKHTKTYADWIEK